VKVSAYIPCYNNSATLEQAISSILKQSIPVTELFILDDASTDSSLEIAAKLGVRVVRNSKNLGRGAVRARAFEIAQYDLVLGCDATNSLSTDFLERACSWMECNQVAGVFGRIVQEPGGSVLERWRGRHLFKANVQAVLNRQASLATGGVLMRKSIVLNTGNFDPKLRHSEDADLGGRVLSSGFDIIFDPSLTISAKGENNLNQLLERYWRWNAGKDERIGWRGYLKQIVYSIRVMAVEDAKDGDLLSVPISLFTPHYQFWRSVFLKSKK
jgi:glycosyltransferase involved in cell wall biosynthesis